MLFTWHLLNWTEVSYICPMSTTIFQRSAKSNGLFRPASVAASSVRRDYELCDTLQARIPVHKWFYTPDGWLEHEYVS